ncbi:trypsin-like peptidase domain-containing protein [Inquilinus sp. OTU3971]|uniref:trypsin-like peptidase domain-containing protein n=1 Tax=Inquilinus sp. OTU3971 TaxID=3043855 RepID=UPI00313D7F1E
MRFRSGILVALGGALLCPLGAPPVAAQQPTTPAPATDPLQAEKDLEARLNFHERRMVQESLIWAGTYYSFTDGAFGKRTREAISAWQTRSGYPATGYLSEPQLFLLIGVGFDAKEQNGWVRLYDPKTQIIVSYPSKLFTKREENDANGYDIGNPDDGSYLRTARFPNAPPGFIDGLYNNGSADRGQTITYTFRRGDIYIRSGTRGSWMFYERGEQRGSEARAYRLNWPAYRADMMGSIVIAMSDSFYPFGYDTPQEKPTYPTFLALTDKLAPSVPERSTVAAATPPQRSSEPPKTTSSGTGFVISRDGYIVTNRHVVEGCASLRFDGKPVDLVTADTKRDLALLRTTAQFPTSIPLREAVKVDLGETVIVLGYPYRGVISTGLNITDGIVTSLSGPADAPYLFQLNAQVQPGNSGGPIVDDKGQLIGVVVARANDLAVAEATGTLPQNINFGIRGELLSSFLLENGVIAETTNRPEKVPTKDIAAKLAPLVKPVICN